LAQAAARSKLKSWLEIGAALGGSGAGPEQGDAESGSSLRTRLCWFDRVGAEGSVDRATMLPPLCVLAEFAELSVTSAPAEEPAKRIAAARHGAAPHARKKSAVGRGGCALTPNRLASSHWRGHGAA